MRFSPASERRLREEAGARGVRRKDEKSLSEIRPRTAALFCVCARGRRAPSERGGFIGNAMRAIAADVRLFLFLALAGETRARRCDARRVRRVEVAVQPRPLIDSEKTEVLLAYD